LPLYGDLYDKFLDPPPELSNRLARCSTRKPEQSLLSVKKIGLFHFQTSFAGWQSEVKCGWNVFSVHG